MDNIEELDIDLAGLEEIGRATQGFHFPVATVGGETIYFNIHSAPLLGDAIRWLSTPEYIIGLPAPRGTKNAFNVNITKHTKNGTESFLARFPDVMKYEKKVQAGYYKLYRYKNGFAFKRYERITNDD